MFKFHFCLKAPEFGLALLWCEAPYCLRMLRAARVVFPLLWDEEIQVRDGALLKTPAPSSEVASRACERVCVDSFVAF